MLGWRLVRRELPAGHLRTMGGVGAYLNASVTFENIVSA